MITLTGEDTVRWFTMSNDARFRDAWSMDVDRVRYHIYGRPRESQVTAAYLLDAAERGVMREITAAQAYALAYGERTQEASDESGDDDSDGSGGQTCVCGCPD